LYVHKPKFGFQSLCANQGSSVSLQVCTPGLEFKFEHAQTKCKYYFHNDQKFMCYVSQPWAFFVTYNLTSHIFDSHYQCQQSWLYCLWLLAQWNSCHKIWYIY